MSSGLMSAQPRRCSWRRGSPDRVTSLTIGGGAVRSPVDAGGALKDVIEAPSLDAVRGLDARTNIGRAVEAAAPSVSEPRFTKTTSVPTTSGGSRSRPGSCATTPSRIRCCVTSYLKITTPTQVVAGREDDLVPWSNNQYLDDLLPHSEIHPLDAGHFAWEQAADDYGGLVVDWVSAGYARVCGGLTQRAPSASRQAAPASCWLRRRQSATVLAWPRSRRALRRPVPRWCSRGP